MLDKDKGWVRTRGGGVKGAYLIPNSIAPSLQNDMTVCDAIIRAVPWGKGVISVPLRGSCQPQ